MTNRSISYSPTLVAIHASAVAVEEGALVFLGNSGAGKSTMCRMLSTYALPLADDKVYLVLQRNRWTVVNADRRASYNLPSKREAEHLDKIVPLRGILRLQQADTSALDRIGTLESCRYLLDAFSEIWWHTSYEPQARKRAFSILAAVARSVPGYLFQFNLSPQTAALLEQEFGAWEQSQSPRLHDQGYPNTS